MNKWKPCKRRDFIRKVKKLGFDGPFFGTRHQFMVYKHHRLTIPSNVEFSVPQLRMMILEMEEITGNKISAIKWNQLKD